MRQIATWCFRHRLTTVLAWLAALAALIAAHTATGSAYTDNFRLPSTGSFQALALLQRASPLHAGETDQLVIAVRHGSVDNPSVRARAQRLLAEVASLPYVAGVSSPYAPSARHQIAPGGQVALADVNFGAHDVSSAQARRFVHTIMSASGGGVQFDAEGNVAAAGNPGTQSLGLEFGLLAAAVVLFAVFGSFFAVLLPLITAGVSLGAGISVVGLLSNGIDIATFTNELSVLIGLGVGVDYALFIVTRYKQALNRGATREAAVVEAIDTSGRAVMFAGMIVCIAMLGMFALGVGFLYGVAVAAAVTVAFTVVAALTLLPALLSLFGGLVPRRKERRAIRDGRREVRLESPAWVRWADAVSRRPAIFAAGAALAMVLIALPLFSMRLGSADAGTDPANTTTRKAYDLLAKGFGPGYNGPLQLVARIDGAGQLQAFRRVQHAIAHTPGVVGTTGTQVLSPGAGRPTVALAQFYPAWSPQAASTSALLTRIRGQVIPSAERGTALNALVGGKTAIVTDFSHVLSTKLPVFIGTVVLLSFLLLVGVFRSLLIPLTAALMNMLSAGAAFGVMTAVFQFGWLGGTTGPIETFVPVLMFPILFGLSMDYEVFLISRIYEEWHRRGENDEAIVHGLAATGRTITAAAAIMVLVFGSFVLGGDRVIELFGVGLATAVALDALIVRSVLVPALMFTIGDANWHLPRWLRHRLPHLNVEGRGAREVAPEPAAG